MSVELINTQDEMDLALWNFITSLLPVGVEVIKGGQNAVLPAPPCVIFSYISDKRLSTNDEEIVENIDLTTTLRSEVFMQVTYQLDFYGNEANDYATLFTTVFRSYIGCDALPEWFQPLNHSHVRRLPFINEQHNYENRLSLDIELEYNPVVKQPIESAAVAPDKIPVITV